MNSAFASFIQLIRRWPFCSVCVALTLLFGGGIWFLLGENENLRVTHRARAAEWEAMLAKLVGGSTLRQEVAAVRETTHRIDENLVVESNLAENVWYFYKIEEQTKVRLPELHPISSPISDKSTLFRRVPFSMRVIGNYEQAVSFLLAIETGPRLAKITSFNFARSAPGSSTLTLDLSVEILGKK